MPSDQGYTDKNWQPKNKTSLMNVMVAINLKIWTNKKYGICVDNLVALNKDVFNTDIVILCIENIELGAWWIFEF